MIVQLTDYIMIYVPLLLSKLEPRGVATVDRELGAGGVGDSRLPLFCFIQLTLII